MSSQINMHYLNPKNRALRKHHGPYTKSVPQQDSGAEKLDEIEPKKKRKGKRYRQK